MPAMKRPSHLMSPSPALAIDDEWTPISPRLCTASLQRWLRNHTGEDGRGVFDESGRFLRGFVLNDFNQFGATIVGQFQQIDRWGAYTIMYIDVGPTINPRLNKPGICIRAQMITDREVPQPQ